MKKILILLILINIFVLSGCRYDKKNIVVLMYDETDMFINDLSSAIQKELSIKYNVELYGCNNNQLTENEIILNTIKDTDMYIINLVDRVSANSIIKKIQDNKIPIIFYNREPNKSDITLLEDSYYVGGDSYKDGILQSDIVHQLYQENKLYVDKNGDNIIDVLLIKGEKYHQDAEKRTAASIEQLKQLGYQVNILEQVYCNWQYTLGYNAAKKAYREYSNIELVLSNNDEMAVGVIDYFKEVGYFQEEYIDSVPPTIIIGVDGTASGLNEISKGTLYATVLNDIEKQTKVIALLVENIFSDVIIDETFPYNITNDRYIYIDGKVIIK